MSTTPMTLKLVNEENDEQDAAIVSDRSRERSAGAGRIEADVAIDVRAISKRYGDRDVLADVSVMVRSGCLHALLGPNGAGKSTLMRVMLGLIRPDAGSVRLLGAPVRATTDSLANGVAGYVDSPNFYPYLSGRRNLTLLARLDDGVAGDHRSRVNRALGQVGLGSNADVSVHGYSAGMRQRLGLAAALLRSPKVLLLDEPTSSLDPAAARDVRTLVKTLAREGVAVVLSSHDMAEVEELCEELTVIKAGRVAYSGSAEELRLRAPAAVFLLHASDNRAAHHVGLGRPGLRVRLLETEGEGIEVVGDAAALDAYTIALGQSGIAVRSLERHTRSLESLFLELTRDREVQTLTMAPVEDQPSRSIA